MSIVFVTGGSGFIGSHSIVQLLAAGHQVRTTVRDLKREGDVRAMLRNGGAEPGSRLSFAAADLTRDAGWAEAVAGCEYVLHVASPLPPSVPKNEDELIVPARDGALRVLRAARDAGVKRVVLTSSFAAVGYGYKPQSTPFDETNWTHLDGDDVAPYPKSKTLAERAAWDFIAKEGGGLELSVVNPVGVFGPVLGPDYLTSILIVQRLMDGALPGSPKLSFGVVDVRDVVDLHIPAMTLPAAKDEIPCGRRGFSLDARDRADPEGAHGAAGQTSADGIANWMARLVPSRSGDQADPPSSTKRNATQRKGTPDAWLDAAVERRAITVPARAWCGLVLLKDSPKRAAKPAESDCPKGRVHGKIRRRTATAGSTWGLHQIGTASLEDPDDSGRLH